MLFINLTVFVLGAYSITNGLHSALKVHKMAYLTYFAIRLGCFLLTPSKICKSVVLILLIKDVFPILNSSRNLNLSICKINLDF